MVRIKNFAIFSLLFCVVFISCKKDEQNAPALHYPVYDFFSNNAATSQTFTVNASQEFSITTTGGVIFTFQPNSFKTEDNAIALGDISIIIKEIGDYKDKVRNNVPTTNNGKLIYLSNPCYITATQNNKPLTLISPYRIANPDSSYGITMYYGLVSNQPANSNSAILNWQNDTATYSLQNINGANCLCFSANRLGWVAHGDKWNNAIERHTLNVEMPVGFYQSNTAIFVSLTNNNMVGRVLPLNASSSTFTFTDIPNSMDFAVLTISFKDNKYYSSTYIINLEESQTINFDQPYESSIDDILARINNLP